MTEAPTGATPLSLSLSHLLIRADDTPSVGHGAWAALLRRLRSSVAIALRQRRRTAAGVRIDDLQGRHFFASEDARSLIDVSLPAGTYHVTVQLGDFSRRYTVTLAQGTTVDLHLPPAPERP